MKAFQILDIKNFMGKLLVKDTFDHFRVSELSVTTKVSYNIDGMLHPEFYSIEDAQTLRQSGETHISWEELKPFCFSIIKGPQTPLNLKIVFALSASGISELLEQCGANIGRDDIFGLYLNCQYENNTVMCVTGTSLRVFTMDKTLDYAWDDMVRKFLKEKDIPFEQV